MKRLLILVFTLGLMAPGLALAAPGDTVTVGFKGLQRGSIVEGTVAFEVEASSAPGIKKLELFVGDTIVTTVEPNGVKQKITARHDWITSLVEDSSEPASNGEYALRARAVANGGASKEALVRVIVDNPASVPTGLTATPGSGAVALRWDPNPEPDILGYEIQRGDGTSFVGIGQTSDTFFEDRVEGGTHSYRVVAVRNSAARSSGRPSFPTESVEVTVAAAAGRAEKGSGGASRAIAAPGSRGFKVNDSSFAPRGLPGGVSLPGDVGQSGLPDLPDAAVEWGSFDKKLPYELPEGGIPLSASDDVPSDPAWKVIPSDGMRWIGIGALLLLAAAGLRVAAKRIEVEDPKAAELEL